MFYYTNEVYLDFILKIHKDIRYSKTVSHIQKPSKSANLDLDNNSQFSIKELIKRNPKNINGNLKNTKSS